MNTFCEENLFSIIFVYVSFNILLFFVYKLTSRLKILHRIVSTIDNLLFILILGYGFYSIKPLLVILTPCVLLIVYPLSWGINKELSDDDITSTSRIRGAFFLSEETQKEIILGTTHFVTFPFYYLIDSWSSGGQT